AGIVIPVRWWCRGALRCMHRVVIYLKLFNGALMVQLYNGVHPWAPLITFYPLTTDPASSLAADQDVMFFQLIVGFSREIQVDRKRHAAFCVNTTKFFSVGFAVGGHFERSHWQAVHNVISARIRISVDGSSLPIGALNLYLRSSKWFAVHILDKAPNRGVLG